MSFTFEASGAARARAFYRKHGFADVGVKPHAVGGKMYELAVMARAIEGAA